MIVILTLRAALLSLIIVVCLSGRTVRPLPYSTQITATPHPIRLEETRCPVEFASNAEVVCKTLIVPENRAKPDGRQIRIAVGIARSGSKAPQADPIFYLHGGPGMSVVWRARWWPNSPFRVDRDVIVLDQRGGGFSEPSLHCPEMDDLALETLTKPQTFADAARYHTERALACAARLTQSGIDLTQYTNTQIAADIDDLRSALGYGQINLFAWSAGTRAALYTMNAYPASIRAAILDSVYMPPGVAYYGDLARNAQTTFEALFSACEADPACRDKHGDLKALYVRAVDRLNTTPARFPVKHPYSDATISAEMNGHAFAGLLYRAMYEAFRLSSLPAVIAEVSRGEYGSLPALLDSALAEPRLYSAGVNHSIYCLETAPAESAADVTRKFEAVDPHYQGFYHWDFDPLALTGGLCDKWPKPPPAEQERTLAVQRQPIKGNIPTLVLAGTFDPASPPAHGRLVAAALSKSYFVEFPTMGHFSWEYGGACPKQIALGFLNDPERAPDTACIAGMEGMRFAGNGGTGSTPRTRDVIMVAVVAVVSAAVIGIVGWWRYQRRGSA